MKKPLATAYTESSWDALQDGLELVLRVFSGPRSTEELAAETRDEPAQVERTLARLAVAGIIRKVDGRWEAVARHVHGTRQEGMVTFLTRYVLPSLMKAAQVPGAGFWTQMDLHLGLDEQASMRSRVWTVNQELNELSLQEADEPVACTAVWVGTSDVPKMTDPMEKAMETVRRTARQRLTPEAAERAVLWQFFGSFGRASVPHAEQLVKAEEERLRARECRADQPATYTLLFGFFVRDRLRASGGEDVA